MNLEAIPRSFWNAASFALMAFTIGFLFISYKYGDLTVKINNLEIRSTNATVLEESLSAQENNLKQQEHIIAAREKQIEELAALLEAKVKELEEVKRELASLQANNDTLQTQPVLQKIERLSKDQAFREELQQKQNTLEALKLQQQRQEDRYAQQRDIFSIQQQQQMKWIE